MPAWCNKTYMQSLKRNKESHKYNVNPDQFTEINSPEAAYFLGFLWADGHVNKNGYSISMSILQSDMENVKEIFNKLGKWCVYEIDSSKYNPTSKMQTLIQTSNRILNKYLSENGYYGKSSQSACQILSKIPKNLQHYWFRGLVDGDGCFYLNKERRNKEIFIASSYEQDWTYMINLCKKLDIDFNIKKEISQSGRGSTFRITKSYAIKKFGDYIYHGYENDKIGLVRKYNSFQEILIYVSKERDININKKGSKYLGVRKNKEQYLVVVKIRQKMNYFRYFQFELDAALFYDKIVLKNFGNRVKTNERLFKEDFALWNIQAHNPNQSVA